jgi:hypothetical protein
MDGRGLTVLIALSLVGCRGAAAADDRDAAPAAAPAAHAPGHGIDVPAGWRELPAIADAAVAAATKIVDDAEVHAHAWGETSRGCYLAIVELVGSRRDTIPKLKRELQAALEASAELANWTTSPDNENDAEITTKFTAGRLKGAAHVHLAVDGLRMPRALAAACFYNERQPEVCEGACAPLLTMLAPPPVTQ